VRDEETRWRSTASSDHALVFCDFSLHCMGPVIALRGPKHLSRYVNDWLELT
jgi:hypothetical protein